MKRSTRRAWWIYGPLIVLEVLIVIWGIWSNSTLPRETALPRIAFDLVVLIALMVRGLGLDGNRPTPGCWLKVRDICWFLGVIYLVEGLAVRTINLLTSQR